MNDPKQVSVIMVADIKLFAKKIHSDERAAFELLKTYDAIMRGFVAQFGGNVIRTLGDYFTVHFLSPLEALKCAIEIQKRFWSFNLGKLDFESIEVSIGIHSEDIVREHDKISEEGIEAASLIEAVTEPRRICISVDVYNLTKSKIAFQAFFIGSIKQKSTGSEFGVYEVLIESIAEFARPSESARQKLTTKKIEELYEKRKDEAQEAAALEEVKERSIRDQPGITDLKKVIEESYKRVDVFYKEGHFEDAEKELEEIYKLYPNYGYTDDRKKEEEDNERRAQERIIRAREYLQEGNFDAAETEINRIFHIFPLHLEAQRVAQEIEDKRAEERCALRLIKARGYFLKGQLDESEAEVNEIFNVLPNHVSAQLLIRQIAAAKQKLKEEERIKRVEETLIQAKSDKDQLIQEILSKTHKKIEPPSPPDNSASSGNIPDSSIPKTKTEHIVATELPPKKTDTEISEIKKLYPHYQDPVERHKEEAEKNRQTEEHLTRSQTYLQRGDLESAEKEINAIFQHSPLHSGAHHILQQIEDARYKKENNERSKKIEKSIQVGPLKEDIYIQELLAKARILLEAGEFAEVTFALHDIFKLNPNHEGARQIKESLQKAKEEKAMRRRAEADQAEKEPRAVKVVGAAKHSVSQQTRRIEKSAPPRKQTNYKFLFRIAVVCIAVAVLWTTGGRIFRFIFPKTASIAVLNFTPLDNEAESADIAIALSWFLKDDFARCEHVTTAASISQKFLDPQSLMTSGSKVNFNTQYFLTGDVQHRGHQYTITVFLINTATHEKEYKVSFHGEISAIPKIRAAIIRSVLQNLEIETVIPDISSLTPPADAYQKYLSALHLIQRYTLPYLDSAATILRQCLEHDKDFTSAEMLLAQTEIDRYRLGGGDVLILKEAFEHAQRALNSPMEEADAYRVIGEYYYFTQKFDRMIVNINKSLELQPGSARSHRDLSIAYLGCGDFDAAVLNASIALRLEPVNGVSYLTLGLVKHFQKDYAAAAAFYQQAIRWGISDSLVTSQYLMAAWESLGQSDKVLAFWKNQLDQWPNDYHIYYFIGRAYQKALNIPIAEQTSLYQGSFTEGLRLAHQALEMNPRDPFAHAYAALFHSRLGTFSEGEAEIKKAVDIYPGSAKIHYLAADVYSIQKNSSRALLALKVAVAIKYDPSEILNPDLIRLADNKEFNSIIMKPIQPSGSAIK